MDFSAEMERALWALDCAVLVISGTEGVQGHTRTLWKLLEQQDIPCILFVNKMDISSRGEEELMEELRRELSENCVDMTGWQRAGLTEGEKDALAMCDEELMEEYLKTGDFAVETLRKRLAEKGFSLRLRVRPEKYRGGGIVGCALRADRTEGAAA
mgnify:CR=1 FL=1